MYKLLLRNPIYACEFIDCNIRKFAIECAASSRDIVKSLVKVRSSNVWAYNLNIKENGDRTGDLYIQFKNKDGGPGDIYVLYDVPVNLYRKLVTAPSKGHAYWQYFRDNFKYAKLTGDKQTKLANGI